MKIKVTNNLLGCLKGTSNWKRTRFNSGAGHPPPPLPNHLCNLNRHQHTQPTVSVGLSMNMEWFPIIVVWFDGWLKARATGKGGNLGKPEVRRSALPFFVGELTCLSNASSTCCKIFSPDIYARFFVFCYYLFFVPAQLVPTNFQSSQIWAHSAFSRYYRHFPGVRFFVCLSFQLIDSSPRSLCLHSQKDAQVSLAVT